MQARSVHHVASRLLGPALSGSLLIVVIIALSVSFRREPALVRAVNANRQQTKHAPLAPTLDAASPAPPPSGQENGNFTAVVEAIRARLGLRLIGATEAFSTKTYHGPIHGAAADAFDLDRYSEVLRREFWLYPVSLIRRSSLQSIILCGGLSFDGQNRSAIPDFEHNALYLDVTVGRDHANYERNALHHEFFHIIDYRDDGELYSDHRWAKLNPKAFRYGQGGARMQEDRLSSLPSNDNGFLTKYATSGVEEDKAEVFAHLMTDHAAVERRAETDDVIKRKVAFMKILLADFCPDMSESYWNDLERSP